MKTSKEHFNSWRDQEAWLISIHGTELRLVTSFISGDYLSRREQPCYAIPTTDCAVVFVKLDEERPLAVNALVALIDWLKSGNAADAYIASALWVSSCWYG